MEESNEVKTENVPQLRKTGRPRQRSQSDYKALADSQKNAIEQLKEQNERLMALITSGQIGNGNPLSAFLPLKPIPVARPSGYQVALRRIKEHENDDNAVHIRTVPERPDNPNEPDPRICVFCLQNVPALYGHSVNFPLTPEGEALIKQCFIMHQQDAMAKKNLEGAKYEKDRRFAADHLEMTATKVGRVPDAVANFMGREWTSAEWNERELKIWEDNCRKIGRGMAQGGA